MLNAILVAGNTNYVKTNAYIAVGYKIQYIYDFLNYFVFDLYFF